MSTNLKKRQLGSGISILAVAAALTIASPALAQVQSGSLSGTVQGAAPGTQVVAVDTVTGQRTVGTVDAQGRFGIHNLRPSTYTVTVPGQAPQTATLNVGQSVELDFGQAAPTTGADGAAIVVTGRRTAQPVQAQTVATNITTAQIENLPQNQRNFLDFAALAPGIAVSSGQNKQVQAGALNSSNVNVLLDGMSFKNPINFGGVFGQNFGLGNPFPQIAIQEYQVQTQNFGAETGQAGSAVISAITKTGGQDFHGSAFVSYQPKAFIEKPFFSSGPKADYKRLQYGGELGGPIIPGKLHFYVAGEGLTQKLPNSPRATNVQNTFPTALVEEVNASDSGDFAQGLLFGKLTFFASDANTINAIAYRRRESNLTDVAGNATESHGRHIETQQDRYQLQWNHNAGDFFNQLNVAYDKGTQATPRVTTGPEFIVSNSASNRDFSEGIVTGAHFFEQGDKQRFITLKNDATLRRGPHTLKAGVLLNFMSLQRTENNAFEGRYYYFNPGPAGTFSPTVNQPYAGRINTIVAPTLKADNTQIGLYVQDEWKPDDHWTVNAGIRWDLETNANNNDYETPEAVANAIRNYPGWPARGIDPEDYISDGNDRKPFYGAFQPRLGISYDVHGDRDTVIFGGAGRYYDRTLFIASVVEAITNSSAVRTVFFCDNGGPSQGTGTGVDLANCAQFNPALLDPEALRDLANSQGGIGGAVWVMPNKIKMPYSDQFDIGIRKRFGDITATATLSHIRSHNINMYARANFYSNGWYTTTLTPGGCVNGGDQWIIDFTPNGPFPNCPATNGQLTGFQGKFNRGLNNGKATYNAVFLQVEKPFTDRTTWGFTTALTIQRARSNVPQELNSLEMYNAPEFGAYGTNHVNGVEKWRLVNSGNFRAPFGITLSGILTLSSGPAFGNIVAPWTGLQGPVPEGACCYGNLGGVFFPDKDIGYKRLDVRVAKTFKTPWGHELTADFQAFNVFNWLNRSYSSWGAGGGADPTLVEDAQVGNDQRQFQAGLRYKF